VTRWFAPVLLHIVESLEGARRTMRSGSMQSSSAARVLVGVGEDPSSFFSLSWFTKLPQKRRAHHNRLDFRLLQCSFQQGKRNTSVPVIFVCSPRPQRRTWIRFLSVGQAVQSSQYTASSADDKGANELYRPKSIYPNSNDACL
jgi:hypothetical protein